LNGKSLVRIHIVESQHPAIIHQGETPRLARVEQGDIDGKIAEPDGAKVAVGFMGESTPVGLDTTTTR